MKKENVTERMKRLAEKRKRESILKAIIALADTLGIDQTGFDIVEICNKELGE